MENSKETTIHDIAKSLNLSPSTVSRALKNGSTVNQKTKKRVSDTAAKMGYRANLIARSLRQQNSYTIGVMAFELNSRMMTSVLAGIEKIANENGYGIIITDASQSVEKEAANAFNLFNRRVDGVIACTSPGTGPNEHFKPFSDNNIPVIFLDRPGKYTDSTSVIIDNMACGYLATKHLIDQGCRRIAHITCSLGNDIYTLRYKGYLEALAESKITFDEKLLVVAAATEEASWGAAKTIIGLNPLPDGIFVTDDFAAAVVMRTFLDHSIRVPRDIAIVGFNNDIIGRLLKPTLSTVNYPGKEIGEAAARILVNRLKGGSNPDNISTVTIRAELIVRESSSKKA